jgi:hypothetical protein
MNIDVVARFLALPSDQNDWSGEDWQLLFDRDAFFTVCSGAEISETIEQLNNLLPERFHLTSICTPADNSAGFSDKITYSGKTLSVPYVGSGEDSLIAVLTINELLGDEIDIRLSYDSLGNSDHSFLPLAHTTWTELEAKFGIDLVNKRFVSLPKSWAELEQELVRRTERVDQSSTDTPDGQVSFKQRFFVSLCTFKVGNLLSLKFLITYCYVSFFIFLILIFYMHGLRSKISGFDIYVLIVPLFVAALVVHREPALSRNQLIWLLLGLFVGCPILFFTHVAFTM